jgi:hypothetical protein
MLTRPLPRPARRSVWPAAGVLLLHAIAGGLALRLTVWRDRVPPAAAQAPVLLWWPASQPVAPSPTPARAKAVAPAAALPPAGAPPAPLPTPARAAEPQAIQLPAAEVPRTVPSAASGAAPVAPVAPIAPPALNLALPRGASAPWRQRPAALDDERANSAPNKSLEARIAAAIGGAGDEVVEERLDDGRLRLRRGTACVIVHPSRAGRLDPFNESFSPKARGVENC